MNRSDKLLTYTSFFSKLCPLFRKTEFVLFKRFKNIEVSKAGMESIRKTLNKEK